MNDKRKLLWNSLIYSFKSILGTIFPLITFPYVSNVLGPTNIGKVEYANSIATYFVYFAALGISTYAIREGAKVKDDQEALSKLSAELLVINAISSVLAYMGIFVVCKIPIFSQYGLLILINSSIILFQTIGMEWVFNVKEEFTYVTVRYIIMQILAVAFLFIFVKKPTDYYYYAIYIVLNTCGSNAINFIFLRKHIKFFRRRKLDLKKHLKPVLMMFSISIAATIFANLDTTMLGMMSNESEVGIYHAGLKIDKIAANLIASVSLVVFSRSSYLLKNGDLSEDGQFKKLIVQFNGIMMLISAPITFGLMAVSKNITDVLLSDEYSKSGIVLFIISLNVLLSAISRIYGHQILIVTKNENKYLYSTIFALVLDVSLNYFLIPRYGAIATAISTVVACTASNVYILACASRLTKIRSMLMETLKYCFICVPFIPVAIVINKTSMSAFLKLVAIIAVCAVYYFCMLLFCRDRHLEEMVSILRKKGK